MDLLYVLLQTAAVMVAIALIILCIGCRKDTNNLKATNGVCTIEPRDGECDVISVLDKTEVAEPGASQSIPTPAITRDSTCLFSEDAEDKSASLGKVTLEIQEESLEKTITACSHQSTGNLQTSTYIHMDRPRKCNTFCGAPSKPYIVDVYKDMDYSTPKPVTPLRSMEGADGGRSVTQRQEKAKTMGSVPIPKTRTYGIPCPFTMQMKRVTDDMDGSVTESYEDMYKLALTMSGQSASIESVSKQDYRYPPIHLVDSQSRPVSYANAIHGGSQTRPASSVHV